MLATSNNDDTHRREALTTPPTATKKRRTVVSEYMTRPAIQRAGPMLDVECGSLVQSLYESSVKGTEDVSPEVHFKRMALNFAIMISYGTRFEDVKDPMLLNILEIVETVSTYAPH
jgi:hypothetical protein